MGITTVELVSQKLFIKASLSQFKAVCGQLSDNTDSQKRHGSHRIIIFFNSLQN